MDGHDLERSLESWDSLKAPFCYTLHACSPGRRLEQPLSGPTPVAWFLERQACSWHCGPDPHCLTSGNEFGNWQALLMLSPTSLCSLSFTCALDNIQNVCAWLSQRQVRWNVSTWIIVPQMLKVSSRDWNRWIPYLTIGYTFLEDHSSAWVIFHISQQLALFISGGNAQTLVESEIGTIWILVACW